MSAKSNLGKVKSIMVNHVAIMVDNLEEAVEFYEKYLGMKKIPTANLDYPTQWMEFSDNGQIHISEWKDKPSYRGHFAIQVDNFNDIFYLASEDGVIDIEAWGKVRRLPKGTMQMFLRDPSGNLVEISAPPSVPVDEEIFKHKFVDENQGVLYTSGRNDFRGLKSNDAKLYDEED